MCRRIIVLSYDEVLDVVRHLEAGAPLGVDPGELDLRSEAFPGSRVTAIVSTGAAAPGRISPGVLAPAEFVWGFEAPWGGKLVFNTRIETAARPGGMWERALAQGRCVVPTLGFFESHRSETVRSARTGRPVKRPYVFGALPAGVDEGAEESSSSCSSSCADGFRPTLTLLGGVSENGRLSLVTTAPNECVAPVHDRMPLVLAPDEAGAWLSGDYLGLADRSRLRLSCAPAQPPAPRRFDQAPSPRSSGSFDQPSLF